MPGNITNSSATGGVGATAEPEEQVNHSIEIKLNELKDAMLANQLKIQKSQIGLDSLKKVTDSLKGNITELEKSAEEIDKVVDEFSKALNDLQEKKNNLKNYYDYKEPAIRNALTDPVKNQIKGKIKEIDIDLIEGLETKIKKLKNDIKTDEQNKIDAKEQLAEKQKEYDDLKNRKKEIELKIADLNKLQKTIETFEEERKPNYKRNMYFSILDMNNGLSILEKKIEDKKLKDKLITAWQSLADAKDELREAEKVLNNDLDELKANEKNLTDAKKDREISIFDKISRIAD